MIYSMCAGSRRTSIAVDEIPEHLWELTTWEGSQREQLRRWRALTLREKLLAVEEMEALAKKLAAAGARARRSRHRSGSG